MFLLGRLKHIALILLVVFVVVFFRWNGRVSMLETGVYWLNEKVTWIGERTFLPYGDMEEANERIAELSIERTKLVDEIARLKQELRRVHFDAGLGEYGRLDRKPVYTARVVARTPGAWHSEVVVDLGAADGIEEGYVALTGAGLAGRVVHVSSGNAVVALITGRETAVSAVVREGSIYGIVYGNGAGGLDMEAVPAHAGIAVDDRVVSAGMGGAYPPDIPIGAVSHVEEHEERLSPVVEVTPAADLTDLYFLLLVQP